MDVLNLMKTKLKGEANDEVMKIGAIKEFSFTQWRDIYVLFCQILLVAVSF